MSLLLNRGNRVLANVIEKSCSDDCLGIYHSNVYQSQKRDDCMSIGKFNGVNTHVPGLAFDTMKPEMATLVGYISSEEVR
jgi:hypothetical protein